MFFEAIIKALSSMAVFVLHACTKGAFPRALTQSEEEELIKRMQGGDEAARSKLIEHNLRLVAHITKKYYTGVADNDDLISIGTIGLIKAISTFREDRGIKLATYASRCIENATLTQMSFWLRKELPTGELPNRRQKICI